MAFQREIGVYGPYYNEENEYAICYTVPIKRGGAAAGAISMKKDGYVFCQLIADRA